MTDPPALGSLVFHRQTGRFLGYLTQARTNTIRFRPPAGAGDQAAAWDEVRIEPRPQTPDDTAAAFYDNPANREPGPGEPVIPQRPKTTTP